MEDLYSLVKELQQECSVSSVFLAKYYDKPEESVESVIYIHHNKIFPIFSYALAKSPCQGVYSQKYFFCAEGIQGAFPGDNALRELSLEAYEGVVLEKEGEVVGHLAILDQKKMSSHKDLLVSYGERFVKEGWL